MADSKVDNILKRIKALNLNLDDINLDEPLEPETKLNVARLAFVE